MKDEFVEKMKAEIQGARKNRQVDEKGNKDKLQQAWTFQKESACLKRVGESAKEVAGRPTAGENRHKSPRPHSWGKVDSTLPYLPPNANDPFALEGEQPPGITAKKEIIRAAETSRRSVAAVPSSRGTINFLFRPAIASMGATALCR
jgi:hypothetical protein